MVVETFIKASVMLGVTVRYLERVKNLDSRLLFCLLTYDS